MSSTVPSPAFVSARVPRASAVVVTPFVREPYPAGAISPSTSWPLRIADDGDVNGVARLFRWLAAETDPG
jgi:hypothetical protein